MDLIDAYEQFLHNTEGTDGLAVELIKLFYQQDRHIVSDLQIEIRKMRLEAIQDQFREFLIEDIV